MSSSFLQLTSLSYLDVTPRLALDSEPESEGASSASSDDRLLSQPAFPGVPEEEVQARIDAACQAERQATEQRLEQQHTQQVNAVRQEVATALATFAEERFAYFARVESEVVHLSLAIARKILEREAQIDPLLLAGLVHVALEGMQSGPSARLRVAPTRLALWQGHAATLPAGRRPEVQSDSSLAIEECVLETAGGTARLSYEIQLKEIERGFLDLLGQRPDRAFTAPPAAHPA